MLTKCPECELPVSDKALACPHCGYPMKDLSNNRARHKPNKRRRLPNGFGQISELKGMNLRKPFRAMVTIGKTDEGRPICKLLKPEAYFSTYNDAYQALMEYNKDPYTLSQEMTVEDLYDRWLKYYAQNNSKSAVYSRKSAWNYCSSVRKIKVAELRGRHIRQCIEEGFYLKENGEKVYPSPNMKRFIKVLFNKMLDYAVEYELVDKNYSRTFATSKEDIKKIEENRAKHIPYTDEEIEKLWANQNINPFVDVLLIQCYTGWRPKELELMKLSDIDLDAGTMKGGVKTTAGKQRIVPIHSKIYELVRKRCEESQRLNGETFITINRNGPKNYAFKYHQFSANLHLIVQALGLNPNHKPHDGRAHFITLAKKYKVDEYAIKRIVGHEIADVTEAVYTERDLSWLKSEIEKIK